MPRRAGDHAPIVMPHPPRTARSCCTRGPCAPSWGSSAQPAEGSAVRATRRTLSYCSLLWDQEDFTCWRCLFWNFP